MARSRFGMTCLVWTLLASTPAMAAPQSGWVGAWGFPTSPAAETPAPTRPAGTFRYRLRLTQSGDAVTVRISNPEGAIPLAITSVTVAGTRGSSVPLSFAGHRDVRLAAASSATSDPASLAISPGEDLLVTLTTAAESTDVAGNNGFRSEYTPTDGGEPTLSKSRPFISLVTVHDPAAPCTIVTLGDSITEGARNKDEVRRGWPDRLADRLAADNPKHHCGVVNAGISGNRVLTEGRGVAAVDRMERDVGAVPGATHLIVLEGINDIVRASLAGERPLAAADLISGYRRIIAFAHSRHMIAIGATLTPGWGYRLMTPEMEGLRAEVNTWIRSSGAFDQVIDFDKALRTSSAPPAIQAAYDSGDHLHPGDSGYQAMADAIPAALFIPSAPGKSQTDLDR